ncbi:MAG: putative bifunctional diguanylate cyclase/phosphodiesterase, partial [Euzebya sp.]
MLSFVVIATLGMVLVGSLRHGVIQRTLLDARRSAVTAAATGIQPLLTPADLTRDATPLSSQRLDWLNVAMASAISPQGIVGLKVWDLNHRIIYSDQPDLLGQLFAGPDLLGQTLNGQITSRVTDPTVVGQDPSPQPPMDQHIRMLEVSIPLAIPAGVDPAEATMFTPDGSGQVLGALQIYLPYQPIADRITDQTRELVLVLGWGLLLWALLFTLVSSASQRLTSQAEANRYLSERDPLTGLVNRSVFGMNLTKTMEEGSPIAVALIDLKRFQDINDTLGHSTGDALLRQVSDRLQARLHEGEQLSRMGGDEFGLLLPGVTTSTAARSRVLEVLTTFDRPFQIGGLSIGSDATVGVALSVGLEVPTAEEMMQQADIALYQARFDHARIGVFDPSRNHFTRDRLQLATQFRHALDHNQIEVVFQPQANLRTGKVHSLEALVRWRHPERGLLAPAEFIDLVEQTDLVRDLTARVLDLALYQVRCWRDGGMRLRVSVNISARDCTNPELPTVISQILQRYDLNTDVLTCELTESAMLTNPSAAREVLGRLAH